MTGRALIRLAVVATAADNVQALQALRALAGDRIEHVVHLGGKDADYKANNFFRMRPVGAKRGDLMQGDCFTGAAAALDTGPGMETAQREAIDNLTRGSDQMAYKFHAIQDVQDYHHITHIAHDVMAGMLLREGITHVLFFDIPHMFYDTCLRQAAEALGLEVLILRQSFFPRQFFSMRGAMELGHMVPRAADADAAPVTLPEGGPHLFYMKGVKQEREAPGRLTLRAVVQMITHHAVNAPFKLLNPVYMTRLMRRMHRLAGRFPKWRDPFHQFFHTDHLAYFDQLAEAEETEPDLTRPFVYFPMQWQPEMTTSSLGGRYRDQLLALERLAAMLPEGHLIYVKENPKQNGKMRSPLFFHRMNRIKAVRLMPSHANSQTLLANSVAVANISGTVGWEGVLAGKPVLCFGATWWAEVPGVTRYRPDLRFDEVLANSPTRDDAERFAGVLQARSHAGNVQRQFIRADATLPDAENADLVARTILDLLDGRTRHSFDPLESSP
jgi:Capsule polysaccharide biosynthesis protein